MTLLDDIKKVNEAAVQARLLAEKNAATLATHEEQINGKRGIQTAIEELAEEVRALRRALWTVGGGIVLAAVGFGFSVLMLVGP